MNQCSACNGFVPTGRVACPNCNRGRLRDFARTCLELAAGGTIAVTLMACYGGPPHAYQTTPEPEPAPCQNTDPNAAPGSPQDQSCEPAPLVPHNQQPAPGEFAEPPPGS